MQDGTNKVNAVKIKEICDMLWPPNFDPYRELVLTRPAGRLGEEMCSPR
jgi:hypothetical protein